jgi:hypothetical protein
MHHNIILRLAMGLTGLLVALSLGFAWGVSERERRFATRNTTEGTMYSESAATATYDKRCSACHVPEQTAKWAARQAAPTREVVVFNFLQQHGKASEAENRLIARFLAEKASGS